MSFLQNVTGYFSMFTFDLSSLGDISGNDGGASKLVRDFSTTGFMYFTAAILSPTTGSPFTFPHFHNEQSIFFSISSCVERVDSNI